MRGQPDCDQTADEQQVQDKDDTHRHAGANPRPIGSSVSASMPCPRHPPGYLTTAFPRPPGMVLGADRFAAASLERLDNLLLARRSSGRLTSCSTAGTSSHPALTSPRRCYYDAMAAENPRWTRNGGKLRGTNARTSRRIPGGPSATRSGLRVYAGQSLATQSPEDRQNSTVSIPPLGI